jgi:exonuclease III
VAGRDDAGHRLLQELKAPDEKFPAAAIRAAGYGMMIGGIAPMVSSELILL